MQCFMISNSCIFVRSAVIIAIFSEWVKGSLSLHDNVENSLLTRFIWIYVWLCCLEWFYNCHHPRKTFQFFFRYLLRLCFEFWHARLHVHWILMHFTVPFISCFVFRFCYVILTLFRWFQLPAEPSLIREAGQNLQLKFLTGLASWQVLHMKGG